MNKEIIEILDKCTPFLFGDEVDKLTNYITNLQEELKSANESITWWQNRFNAVEKENKRLKELLESKGE